MSSRYFQSGMCLKTFGKSLLVGITKSTAVFDVQEQTWGSRFLQKNLATYNKVGSDISIYVMPKYELDPI